MLINRKNLIIILRNLFLKSKIEKNHPIFSAPAHWSAIQQQSVHAADFLGFEPF